MGSSCQREPNLIGDCYIQHIKKPTVIALYENVTSNLSAVSGMVFYIQRINSNGQFGEWNHLKLTDGKVNLEFYDENLDMIITKEIKNFQIKIKNNPNKFTLCLGKETIICNGKMSYNVKLMEEVLFDTDKMPNKPNEPNK